MQGIAVVNYEEIRLYLSDIDQYYGKYRVYEWIDIAREGDKATRVQRVNITCVQGQEVIHFYSNNPKIRILVDLFLIK